MPIGFRNAAQILQMYLDNLFQECPFTHVYIDDILNTSATEAEHEQHQTSVHKDTKDVEDKQNL